MTGAKLPDFEERFASVRGVRIRYFVGGAGEPLVLVHGLGGGAANWVELAPALARRRHVLVPDLPGHGLSESLPAGSGLSAFADRVGLLAEREGMLPAAVVGHSFGGATALQLALRRPGDVTGIVLAAAAGISSGRPLARVLVPVFGETRPGRVVAPIRRLISRTLWLRYAVFSWWGASDPPAMPGSAVEGFLGPYAHHADTLTAGLALIREDPRPDLGGVRCPCLVLWGARDHQLPVSDAFEYARRLRAPLRVIPDCGHLLIGERADCCLDAIEWFLALIPGRRPAATGAARQP